jgi:hypothetical protein
MEKHARNFLGAWDEHRAQAEGYRELDAERVLVLAIISGHGKTSGLSMRTKGALIFHLRDGNRAFADLGLTPEGDSLR